MPATTTRWYSLEASVEASAIRKRYADSLAQFSSQKSGTRSRIDSSRVAPEDVVVPIPRGVTRTLAPKARNSVVRRRLASTWRLRRAAVTAAPAPRASNMTKRRPGLALKRRLRMRQNMARLLVRGSGIIRLAGWALVHIVKRGAAAERCQEWGYRQRARKSRETR